MATIKTAVVTAIDAANPPIANLNEYLGEWKWIPVEISSDVADGTHSVEFSKVLPEGTKLVAIKIEHSAIAGTAKTLDIGYTGNDDAIIERADLSSAGTIVYPGNAATAGRGAPIDVGGKKIIGQLKGQLSSDTINGWIAVVTTGM